MTATTATTVHVVSGVDYTIDITQDQGTFLAELYEGGQWFASLRRDSRAAAELDAGYSVGVRARQRVEDGLADMLAHYGA